MTSKIIVNTIEADTGISSVTFASNINLQNDSSILVSSSGVTLGTGSTIAAPSANEITLSTNSAERLRLTSAGSVGIGTDTPGTTKLKIETGSGTRAISLNAPTNGTYITFETAGTAYADIGAEKGVVGSGSADTPVINARGSRDISFRTNSSERLRITSDGKMGLGISSPARGGLHIHKAATAELHLTDDTTGSGSGDGFTLFSTSSSAGVWYRENAPLRFATYNTERVRISSGGNVGINETAPDRTLHVNSGATDTALKLESTDTEVSLELADNTGSSYIGGGGNYLNFYSGGNERLRINSAGNIGVGGITSPSFTTGGGIHLKRNYGIGFGDGSNGRPDFQLVTTAGSTLDFRCGFGADTADISMTTGGNLVFASGGGIDFSATGDGSGTVVSELFDDYEEGSWTPTVEWGGTSATLSGGTYGRYTKIGNTVIINFRINQTARNTTSGSIRVYGLPYNEGSTAAYNHGMVQGDSGISMPAYAGSIMMYIAGATTRFLYQLNNAHADLDASHCVDGTSFYGFATYFTS